MKLEIHPKNPQDRLINQAVEIIKKGGIIIFPTDTIYAIGCDAFNNKTTEQLCRIIGKKPEKANLSLICKDLSDISTYTTPFNTSIFRAMKASLPGPFTFILNANNNVPKLLKTNRKTIGIRVPDNEIVRAICDKLGHPLISASIHSEDDIIEYMNDPEEIDNKFEKIVDLIIDGGLGAIEPSTVIDCTGSEPEIIRQGKGIFEF